VRVVFLGGTAFTGPWAVRELVERGHDVTVFHRGKSEPELPNTVRHVHGDVAQFEDYVDELRMLSPDVVVDMLAFLPEDCRRLLALKEDSRAVEVHPETAQRLGLHDHAPAEVKTPRGQLVLPVKVFAGLMPDVLAIPFGFGRRYGGRWCAGIGENPADLVDPQTDPLTGTSLWNSTWATIRKA